MGNYCEGREKQVEKLSQSLRITKFYFDKYRTDCAGQFNNAKTQAKD